MARPRVAMVEKLIRKDLIDWLGPYGFAPKKGEKGAYMVRRQEGILCKIFCLVNPTVGVSVEPVIFMGFEKVAQIYHHFMKGHSLNAEPQMAVDIDLNFDHFQTPKRRNAILECDTEEDVAPMIENLHHYMVELALPILESLTNPQVVLQWYLDRDDNSTIRDGNLMLWSPRSSELIGLILARIYAPDLYEPLKKRYQAVLDRPVYEDLRKGIDNLIQFLEQDELPTW